MPNVWGLMMIQSKEINKLIQKKHDLIKKLDGKKNRWDNQKLCDIDNTIDRLTKEMLKSNTTLERQINLTDWEVKNKMGKRKCRKG